MQAHKPIRLAHVDPDEWTASKKGAAAHIFKNIVEGESDLKVDLFPAGSLGNETELVGQAQENLTQVVLVSGAMVEDLPSGWRVGHSLHLCIRTDCLECSGW